jgi:predicted small lipoprotein YifL
MNLIKQKTLIFSLLATLFTLTACGLNGDLYQTPDTAKEEDIIKDESSNKKVNKSENDTEKSDNKK